MAANLTDISQSFSDYVIRHNLDSLLEILEKPDPLQHYSLVINFVSLFEDSIELGNTVLSEPEKTLQLFDKGIILAQKVLLDTVVASSQKNSVKYKVHTRITGLPSTSEAHRTVFPRNDDLGNFLKVSGTVVKVSLPKLLEFEREYVCSKCGDSQLQPASFERCYAIIPPKVCSNRCAVSVFTPLKNEDGEKYIDYQEVKIQEEVGKLQLGTIPSSIWVTVDNDLVDTCQPGDHVTVWGTVLRRWKTLSIGARMDVELVLKANNLQVTNYQKTARLLGDDACANFETFWEKYKYRPLVGRDLILASFCPDVYGLYLVKLAMCIVLCGGVPRQDEGGSVRAESHLLLVGDPGTGKSHMLRFAAKTCARSVLTTGVGSTTAGLTVCAVREGSDWQLEGGALVLADGGVCCIDELNSIREQDRTSIHEAMEQQTISVAKAGMVTKLNTRCSILAATNAKGAYDPSQSLSVNVALASPLLSRFDLVLVLHDARNPEWDKKLSSFILGTSCLSVTPSSELWTTEMLQSYFALAKTHNPVLSPGANAILSRYYQAQRSADSRSAARTTVRMLESLVRLSQGHARLMLRDEVTILDAIVAVTLMECSMAASALISAANTLHTSFPSDPTDQYRHQATLIMQKLNLEDHLRDELARLDEEKHLFREEIRPEEKCDKNKEKNGGFENYFSQKLNNIMTDIKRKRDRDICEAASLTGKRRCPPPANRVKKKEKQETIVESLERSVGDVEDGDDDFAHEKYPENRRGIRTPRTSDGEELFKCPKVMKPSRKPKVREHFKDKTDFVNLETSSFEEEQSVVEDIEKRTIAKEVINIDVDIIREKRTDMERKSSMTSSKGKLAQFQFTPRKEDVDKENTIATPSVLGSQVFQVPVNSSTPCKKVAPSTDNSEIALDDDTSNDLSFTMEEERPCLDKEEVSNFFKPIGKPPKSIQVNSIIRRDEGTSNETGHSSNAILPSTSNQRNSIASSLPARSKGFDKDKVKALVKMGRAFSQSQSQLTSQPQSQASQFSLHEKELSWDDLELELD